MTKIIYEKKLGLINHQMLLLGVQKIFKIFGQKKSKKEDLKII